MLYFKGTSFSYLTFSSCGLSEDIFAVVTGDNSLSMAENCIGFTTTSTLDIHEVRIRSRD